MKTIALLDPHQGGHHDWYLELFTTALREIGWCVVVIAPQAETVAARLSDPNVHAITWSPAAEELRPAWLHGCKKLWHSAHATITAAELEHHIAVDVSFFAWMDSWLGRGQRRGAVARAFPRPFAGLVFQPRMFRIPGRAPMLRRGGLDRNEPLHAANCRGVAVLDAKIAPAFARRIARPVVPFPDVPCLECDSQSPVAAQLAAAANGRAVVLLTGVIDGRKGVGTFLRAATSSDPIAWFFAIAGPIVWSKLRRDEHLALRAILDHPTPQAAVITTEPLPEPALNALIRKTDLLWVAYENFAFSSNLLSKAAALRVPVLSNGEHVIGEAVRDHALGFIATTDAERNALFTAAGCARVAEHAGARDFAAGAARFARQHDRTSLAPAVSALLHATDRTRTSLTYV